MHNLSIHLLGSQFKIQRCLCRDELPPYCSVLLPWHTSQVSFSVLYFSLVLEVEALETPAGRTNLASICRVLSTS